METITVNNREYRVKPIKPALLPYLQLWGDLMTRRPKTVQEAEEISREIQELQNKIFAMAVEPTPPDEDAIDVIAELSRIILEKTTRGRRDGGTFRQPPTRGARG